MPTSAADIERACTVLRAGGLVAFPTETVYGLGADAERPEAVAKIFAAKGRPTDHPLIAHFSDPGSLPLWAAQVPPLATALARAFWPGPLTLVLPRSARVPLAVTGGLETVGLRVPAHPVALALLRAFGGIVAAPSANRFGSVSATTAAHVRQDLGDRVDFVLDGGACDVGVESTIVDLSGAAPAILRPGGIPAEAIAAVAGVPVPVRMDGAVRSPGQLPSHYAPRAELRLTTAPALAGLVAEALTAGRRVGVVRGAAASGWTPPAGVADAFLPGGDRELAQGLYAALRQLDEGDCDLIVAVLPAELERGLGLAVADRLQRAAAPRPAAGSSVDR